jgi:hypothetical protein
MGTTGPGENTASAAILSNGRGQRRPTTAEKFPSDLTVRQIQALIEAHAEIADADYSYPSIGSRGPSVPAALADAPNIITPRNFGLYQF